MAILVEITYSSGACVGRCLPSIGCTSHSHKYGTRLKTLLKWGTYSFVARLSDEVKKFYNNGTKSACRLADFKDSGEMFFSLRFISSTWLSIRSWKRLGKLCSLFGWVTLVRMLMFRIGRKSNHIILSWKSLPGICAKQSRMNQLSPGIYYGDKSQYPQPKKWLGSDSKGSPPIFG